MFVVPKSVQAGVKAVGEAVSNAVKQIAELTISPEAVRASSFAELARKAGKSVENYLALKSPIAKEALQHSRNNISQQASQERVA